MRNALGVLAVAGASVLAGCAAPAEVTTATLRLTTLPSCELAPAGRISVRATGDFPAILASDPLRGDARVTFDDFPSHTDYLAFEVGQGEQTAGGLVALDGGTLARDVLLLPFASSCPLGDPLAAAVGGAVLAPLPGGGLLIAGGLGDDGRAVATARVLPPGEALVTDVPGGMLFHRTGASATTLADRVVIAGGGSEDRASASANDTFEIYDIASGTFDKARSGRFAGTPRRDHGAALLGNGRVLLAGGCSALGDAPPAQSDGGLPSCTTTGAEPLATAEWIDGEHGTSKLLDGEMHVARARPRVLVLDSGTVLIALGWDKAANVVREVERFDAKSHAFSVVANLPAHANAAVTVLEGDRVLYLGCDGPGADCELALLVPEGDGFALLPVPRAADLVAIALHDLEQLRLLPLHDGRVLVTGRRASIPTQRRGLILDLQRTVIDSAPLSRVPDQLLELADGTRVEADAAGMSLARTDARSPLDDPSYPNMLQDLALDLAPRWNVETRGLTALADARADVPWRRFADVHIEIAFGLGQGAVLLEPASAPPVKIEARRESIVLPGCSVARDGNALLVIERHATELTLRSGDQRARCEAPALEGRVGIAITAAKDTVVGTLGITRL